MRDAIARSFIGLAVGLLSAIVGLGGGGFLAAALYLALIPIATPAGAAALTGVALLALTGVLLLIASTYLRPRKPSPAPSGGARSETEVVSELVAALVPHVRRHLPVAIGFSFAAGLVLGIKPSARRALWRSLTR
ncbi:hypothetical protein [Aquisalimonas sp.]|uniref:hypothetical protein n=1 Tax=Aquisalimonas sp. TaxID=1872621 RepID=UPI0025C00BB6|nr:hypothetical protein [Aquisalimonas sp.]